jgi:excisionase family DNA binding protein
MTGPEFFQTVMGRRFYEVTMPALVKQLERLNDNLETPTPGLPSLEMACAQTYADQSSQGPDQGSPDIGDVGWLTRQQVQNELQLSRATVEKRLQSGELPAIKIGRQWRIQRSDLDQYMEGKRWASRGS